MNPGPRRPLAVLFLFLFLLLPNLAIADVVILKNGDRVSGTIHKMEDEQLEIDTDYAGKIRIGWGDIQSLRADRPLALTFFASSTIPDGVGIRDGDRVIVTGLDVEGPIRLSDVKAINISDLYHRGNINLGGNVVSGNSNTQALNVAASYTLRQDRHRLQMDGKMNRGEANGELTAQNGAASVRYDYLLARQMFLSGGQLFENDRFQNLGLRSTTTAALGYDFYDRQTGSLSVGAGPGLVYENFTTSPATVTPSATWFVRWDQEFRGGDITLFHHHQGFQDLAQDGGFRLNADQGIRVKIYGDLALNFEYDLRFNTKPSPGRKTVDTTAIFGLSYGFGE